MQKSTHIARYLNVRQAYAPTFSGDGQRLVFLTDITGVPQVWQIPLTGAPGTILWPEQLTFETDRVMLAQFSPAAGDTRLLYTRDVGGNEKQQLFLLSQDGSPDVNLTQGFGNVTHQFGTWGKAGNTVYFAANRRNPALFDFYKQPLDGAAAEGGAVLVWQNETPGYLYNVDVTPDGQRAVVVRASSSFSHTLLEIDLTNGTARQLLASEEPVRFTAVHYSSDGRSLYLSTDLDSDFLYVARLDLDTDALERLSAPEWDCDALALSPDGGSLAYVVNVEGAHHIHLYDLATGATHSAPGFDKLAGVVRSSQLVFSPDGNRIALAFTSATRAADIYVWDLAEDVVYPVTRSAHGGLAMEDFVTPELIHYPTFDALADGTPRTIPAWFFKPQGKSGAPVPAVVVVHGGPEGTVPAGFHVLHPVPGEQRLRRARAQRPRLHRLRQSLQPPRRRRKAHGFGGRSRPRRALAQSAVRHRRRAGGRLRRELRRLHGAGGAHGLSGVVGCRRGRGRHQQLRHFPGKHE